MKTRTVKFLGVLTLVLAGISVYLFAQNTGNTSSAKEKAQALMAEIRSLQGRYCADVDDDDYFNCLDCVYLWVRSYEGNEKSKKADEEKEEGNRAEEIEGYIERHIEKMQRENRSFSDQLLLLKRWIIWPPGVPVEDSFPIKKAKPENGALILKNLERIQWKRTLVQMGEYNILSLHSFLLEGTLTADGCVDALKYLYDEASHNPKKFDDKLESLKKMAKEIYTQIEGVKIVGENIQNISPGFTVVTYQGQEFASGRGAFSIKQQCSRIMELGKN